ncbi:hypothetical protein ACFX13_043251 [Malus domestica]
MKVHITQRDHEGRSVIVSWPHRDLGQTHDSNRTLSHYDLNPMKGQTVLFFGDLTYADDSPFHDNNRWDTGYMGEYFDLVLQQVVVQMIKLYPRYGTPSIERASAYIVFLSPYSAYGKYTPRYKWLEKELPKVKQDSDTMAYCSYAFSFSTV